MGDQGRNQAPPKQCQRRNKDDSLLLAPAKSSTPNSLMRPVGCHTMWAIGQYTTRCHKHMKMHNALGLTLHYRHKMSSQQGTVSDYLVGSATRCHKQLQMHSALGWTLREAADSTDEVSQDNTSCATAASKASASHQHETFKRQ
jgi:hypothetical protein